MTEFINHLGIDSWMISDQVNFDVFGERPTPKFLLFLPTSKVSTLNLRTVGDMTKGFNFDITLRKNIVETYDNPIGPFTTS